jgi:hypothetical protein
MRKNPVPPKKTRGGESKQLSSSSRDAEKKLQKKLTSSVATNPPRKKNLTSVVMEEERVEGILPVEGATDPKLMQKQHGYTTIAGYRVIATKGDGKFISTHKFGHDSYKVKCYPNLAAWGFNFNRLKILDASQLHSRQPYERFFITAKGLEEILSRIREEAEGEIIVNGATNIKVVSMDKIHSKVRTGIGEAPEGQYEE